MLKRRAFLHLSIAAALARPPVARAQPAHGPRRIVVIGGELPTPEIHGALAIFREELRTLGHHDSRDVDIEYLWPAGGREDPLRNFVDEFKARLAVVVLWGERSLQAVRLLRPQPGMVFLLYNEPRLRLHMSSFERPGGNLTGVTATTPTSITEQVQLLKHAAPHISRLAIVWDPSDPGNIRAFNDAFAAVTASRLAGHSVEIRDAAQIPPAIAAAVGADVDALVVIASTVSLGHVAQVVDVVGQHRLPAIYPFHEFAEGGGLMSYGVSFHQLLRRTAAYVDQILKGVKAGELPVDHPAKLTLVINLRSARALGLTIPPSLLLRADQVIE